MPSKRRHKSQKQKNGLDPQLPYFPYAVPVPFLPQAFAAPQQLQEFLAAQSLSTPIMPDPELVQCADLVTSAIETDAHRLNQRFKQICFGYVTEGYYKYRAIVPPSENLSDPLANAFRPKTPNPEAKISKRKWDAEMAHWRRGLHFYDPEFPPPGFSNREDWKTITLPKILKAKQFIETNEIKHAASTSDAVIEVNSPLLKRGEISTSPLATPSTDNLVETLNFALPPAQCSEFSATGNGPLPPRTPYTPNTFFSQLHQSSELRREHSKVFSMTPFDE